MLQAKARRQEKLKTVAQPVTITIEDAKSRYGFSRSRLYVLLAEGKIKAIKEGRRTLIKVDSIDAYIADAPAARFGSARQ